MPGVWLTVLNKFNYSLSWTVLCWFPSDLLSFDLLGCAFIFINRYSGSKPESRLVSTAGGL